VYGNFDVGGVTAYTFLASTAIITFGAASGTQNLNFRSTQFGTATIANGVVFGVAGSTATTYVLTNGFTALSTATITTTLTAGTLNLNNFTLTTGLFSSSNSNTRTLAFGTGKIVLNATSGSIFTTSTATGLTVTGANPLIEAIVGGAGTRTITMGAAGEINAISVNVTAGSDIIGLATTTGAYNNLNFTGFTGAINYNNAIAVYGNFNAGNATSMTGAASPQFASTSGTKTIFSNALTFPLNVGFVGVGGIWAMQDALSITGVLTMSNGTLRLKSGTTSTVGSFATSGTTVKYLQATTPGSQATISDASGTDTVTYLHITDSNATGGAVWNATSTTNTNGGNNTGWLFTTLPTSGFFAFF